MYRHFFKRLLDILLSVTAIILLSPIFLLIGIYVAFSMGCPILFSQDRIGKNGKSFKLYKFRSMTNRKDASGNLLPESDRLTKAGVLLRNSSLDELPELWSILIGKMSLVGPRPMPVYYEPYFLPAERKRHCIRGGLIPPDSLSGKALTSYEEQFRFECDYVDNVSFMLDIKVILATFKILLQRVEDDYGVCERPHLNVYRKDMIINKTRELP